MCETYSAKPQWREEATCATYRGAFIHSLTNRTCRDYTRGKVTVVGKCIACEAIGRLLEGKGRVCGNCKGIEKVMFLRRVVTMMLVGMLSIRGVLGILADSVEQGGRRSSKRPNTLHAMAKV
jgi:hypothetical protein